MGFGRRDADGSGTGDWAEMRGGGTGGSIRIGVEKARWGREGSGEMQTGMMAQDSVAHGNLDRGFVDVIVGKGF